jgi:hypothetical protein
MRIYMQTPICFFYLDETKIHTLKWTISDLTDFSYDFQDLDFIESKKNNKTFFQRKGGLLNIRR